MAGVPAILIAFAKAAAIRRSVPRARKRSPYIQRASRDLAVIEAGRAIQFGDDRRKLGAHAPLVRAAAGRLERVAPSIPPSSYKAGHRFDDEHAIAPARPLDQRRQQRVARGVGELVERE